MLKDKSQTRLLQLEKIVQEEQDRLFRFAYMRLGNRADAEDILQDVFLKLFRSEESLKHISNLEHYLIRSVGNCCRDWQRKKKYNLLPIKDAGQIPIPDEDRQMHEEYKRISKMLEKLPEEQAEIVRLKCSDGLKFREIAKLLEIPEATAKSRYRYAIAHIQKNIKN
ncbi:MAG: sigma-70 family RNA polymerase sigma factor [Bacteroidales bacterium]|nr:sigma-70 family RNA polymerase sigma factor [Bacteroidales bacterium]